MGPRKFEELLLRNAEDDPPHVAPVDGTDAHAARFGGGVEGAAPQEFL